jgi:hypothetical protein
MVKKKNIIEAIGSIPQAITQQVETGLKSPITPAPNDVSNIPKFGPKNAPTNTPNVLTGTNDPKGAAQMPYGRVFFGLNTEDVKNLVGGKEQNLQQQTQQQNAMQQQQMNEQLRIRQQLQGAERLDPMQQQGGNLGEDAMTTALNAGTIAGGVGIGAKLGAMGGGTIGSAVPVVGTAAGAAVGAVGGGILGGAGAIFGKLSLERKQDVKVAKANFDNAKASMIKIIAAAKTNPELKDQLMAQWKENLSVIRNSREALKKQNKSLFGKKLADNLDELSDIEQFYSDYDLFYRTPYEQNLLMGGAI